VTTTLQKRLNLLTDEKSHLCGLGQIY
jgi:hypothetical protein